MSSNLVTYESVDNVAVITLNRPEKLNALNKDLGNAMRDAWLQFNGSEDRVAILTGAGKSFTVGADLSDVPDMWMFTPGSGVEVEKPIITAVHGWCVGGGVLLAQFAELCVATEDTRFSYPEAKVGFSGGLISSIVARMPHKLAMEFILVGEPMTAQRAYEAGFVNKVVAPGKHVEAAMEYADKLKANAPLVMSMLKRFAGQVLPKGPTEAAGIARREVEFVNDSDDFKEGVTSFMEKRTPKFIGS